MEEGRKFDSEKPDWSLLSLELLEGTVKVLTGGARKYDRENWRKVPDARNRYFAACLRHLKAWQSGEEIDPEFGENHLCHSICCLIFLLGVTKKEDEKDALERAVKLVGIDK